MWVFFCRFRCFVFFLLLFYFDGGGMIQKWWKKWALTSTTNSSKKCIWLEDILEGLVTSTSDQQRDSYITVRYLFFIQSEKWDFFPSINVFFPLYLLFFLELFCLLENVGTFAFVMINSGSDGRLSQKCSNDQRRCEWNRY